MLSLSGGACWHRMDQATATGLEGLPPDRADEGARMTRRRDGTCLI